MVAKHGDIERPVVLVIGCDDVGSATAHALHAAGHAVVLVDEIDPPWIRRGRSYTDAWYVGGATLEGLDACFCASAKSIPAVLARADMIAATTWSWVGLAAMLRPRAIVETRPGCRLPVAQARPSVLDGVLTVAIHATQVAGWRADVVIAGACRAATEAQGRREAPLAQPACVAVDAPVPGRFRTRREISERIDAGEVIGDIGASLIVSPATGVLAGLAARGARITGGAPVAEIDPAGDQHRCLGIAAEMRAVARRACAAVREAECMAARFAPRARVTAGSC